MINSITETFPAVFWELAKNRRNENPQPKKSRSDKIEESEKEIVEKEILIKDKERKNEFQKHSKNYLFLLFLFCATPVAVSSFLRVQMLISH
jgi:hypothetical protein